MPQGLDQRLKIEEVVPKMVRRRGLDAGQSRRRWVILQLMTAGSARRLLLPLELNLSLFQPWAEGKFAEIIHFVVDFHAPHVFAPYPCKQIKQTSHAFFNK